MSNRERPPLTRGEFITDDPVDVCVVVVTFNSAADLDALIESLRHEASRCRLRLVIADNSSFDDTRQLVRGHRDVVLVDTGGNLGYAGGVNAGIRKAGVAEAILVLNPDARVSPGAVLRLLESMRQLGAGVVAPAIVDDNGERYPSIRHEPSVPRALGDAFFGRLWRSRPRWLTETSHDPTSYSSAHSIDWASGAALLISHDIASKVGDWDEQFFMYSEETDFQRRVRDAGSSVWYIPDALVHHSERGSGFSLPLDRLIAVNRVRYARKHMNRFVAGFYRAAVASHHFLRSMTASYRAILLTVLDESSWASLPHAERFLTASQLASARGAIVIPAHNEESVIRQTIEGLGPVATAPNVEVLVAANGCTDGTVEIVRSLDVRVLEIGESSKVAAINAADLALQSWPRIYLDADIGVTPRTIVDTLAVLSDPKSLAARPPYVWDLTGASALVKSYYRARGRIAPSNGRLWGAGIYGVSELGHRRFSKIPSVTADDVFVDQQFEKNEKTIVNTDAVRVRVPQSTRYLLRVLRRQSRGAAELASHSAPSTMQKLLHSVRGPRSLADATVYAGLSSLARLQFSDRSRWERDETSRPATESGAPTER